MKYQHLVHQYSMAAAIAVFIAFFTGSVHAGDAENLSPLNVNSNDLAIECTNLAKPDYVIADLGSCYMQCEIQFQNCNASPMKCLKQRSDCQERCARNNNS